MRWIRNTGVPTAVTAGRLAGSGGCTETTRPWGSTVTLPAVQTRAFPPTTAVPASMYVMAPSESRHAYPENPAAAYTVESTGQRDSVVWASVLAHTMPIAYGTRTVTCVAVADTIPPVASTMRRSNSAALIAVRDTNRARFFFQAEDGIRDLYVTGVQTCALPI